MANYEKGLGGVKRSQKPKDFFDCFIATAVYGDLNAYQVNVLRDFRDNVLEHNMLGKAFINFYYSGFGENTANFIRKKAPRLIPAIRQGLDYIVNQYESSKK